MFIADNLDISDPVLAFDKIMEEIRIEQYLKPEEYKPLGRPGYCRVNMLKTILFGFMDSGYATLRELEDRCKTNIRYMYLMDYETPSYRAFGYFINKELKESIEDIFKAVMSYIRETEHVDLQHVYIDGSKFEANANKYTWVWKKSTEKSRYKLFGKITALLEDINKSLVYVGFHIETNAEYTPEYLDEIAEKYREVAGIEPSNFVHGRGHHKSLEQRFCEKLKEYTAKLKEYKETKDEKYRTDPFRAVNFKTDTDGDLICPNNRKFRFAYQKAVKGHQYGRQEEIYVCEDCSECPYAAACKKTDKNRSIRLNQELTAMHREVLDNLECTHGALLRMNRSTQAEGTFGILKYDRWYKRVVRRGLDSVRLELLLVSVGHNLYKFHNKQKRLHGVA